MNTLNDYFAGDQMQISTATDGCSKFPSMKCRLSADRQRTASVAVDPGRTRCTDVCGARSLEGEPGFVEVQVVYR